MGKSGKSVILRQIIDELKDKGIADNQIIYINFEYADYINIMEAKAFNDYVENKLISDKWERIINSFKAKHGDKVSIFITGSNSDLLSGELATHIAGRYVSFNIFPFTFKEVCELKKIENKDKYSLEKEFNDFVILCGMPQRFILNT